MSAVAEPFVVTTRRSSASRVFAFVRRHLLTLYALLAFAYLLVPVAVVGAEEQAPALWDFKAAAKMIGFPSLPVTPTVVPVPLPVKYRLYFGAPMRFSGSADDEDAELERKVKEVKARVQSMLSRGVEERKGIFF